MKTLSTSQPNNPYQVILIGGSGRMGKRLIEQINHSILFNLLRTINSNTSITSNIIKGGDIIIDFSTIEATKIILPFAAMNQCPYLCGVTGFIENINDIFLPFARKIPIFYSANMSYGIAILKHILPKIEKMFPIPYKIEILDQHHALKKDSPSGTAKSLGESLKNNKNIKYHSVRNGDIVGEHTISFINEYETINLQHIAHTRDLFAKGALEVAKWLINQQPGLHTFEKMLF